MSSCAEVYQGDGEQVIELGRLPERHESRRISTSGLPFQLDLATVSREVGMIMLLLRLGYTLEG